MKALSVGLMVLGLMEITVVGICGGNEEVKKEIIAQGRETKEISPPASSINKVVIGVLDFEIAGGLIELPMTPLEQKKALMRELRRNARVKLVDIRESCSLSDLKRHEYRQAEQHKNIYQLDMILHIYMSDMSFRGGTPIADSWEFYFSFIDLYTKKVKEVSMEIRGTSLELGFKGISRKLLVSKDLRRVLRAKKKVQGVKEVAVPRKVGESPEEIEDFMIQYGPRLIAEDQYNRILELIEDLPGRKRRHIQIRTMECFDNLKGWVCDKDKYCKVSWWKLRQKLIDSEDNEATPMLLIFLKDEDHWMRIYAAELLGHIGNKRALQDLRAAGENDENRKVRKYAKRAYEQISGEEF